jgi:two-component system chemotaxis sensor kinase CheA
MEDLSEFRQIFFTECHELLTDMEERLLKLDVGTQDKEQLNAIFRCAHSIKGGAGAFGLDAIMRFTHILEALLDEMREGHLMPTREAIDALLKSVDIVNQMLAAAEDGREVVADFGAGVAATLQSLTTGTPHMAAALPIVQSAAPVSSERTYNVNFAPHPTLLATGNEPFLILRELSRLAHADISVDTSDVPELDLLEPVYCNLKWTLRLQGDITEDAIWEAFEFVRDLAEITVTEQHAIKAPELAEVKKTVAEEAGPAKAAATTSIRVDLEKIDRLVNMVGELVITEAMLRAQVRSLPVDQFTDLMRGIDELSHHTRELQESVMAVRMQPVKSIFSRMPRIVRDTAAQLGKDIQLVLSGENTEVDKTVIESLSDPLTHMIRNSLDHGIETPDQRVWNNKPVQGTIHLSAYHRSGRIIIEISDDGAGINRQRVLSKAIEKGLVAADAQLSDDEIDHLIFLPGFSTAEKVTSVSGRGVGMDVVRRNIESLGGTVRITNNPGTGSIFTVSLPLTLAILDGMIVRVGSENYIVPITSIIETLRPKAEEIHKVQGRSDVINVRGEFVQLMYLNQLFGIANAENDVSKALIVLVESGNSKMGLVVDELVGQQQVVIKSLEANSDPVKGISGATILGDGKVSLILEINELKNLCQNHVVLVQAA